MDLLGVWSVQAIVILVPFVIYCLFFMKKDSERDFFYPIKFYLAKKVVRNMQNRKRKTEAEPEVAFTSQQSHHYQSYQGSDQQGNSLKLKLTLRPNKTAEVVLYLTLSNGNVYTFPDSETGHVVAIKDYQWRVNGLTMEMLEPYKRSRLIFNGLLQNISKKTIEHIQFSFIFNCCSSPKFFPDDIDPDIIAESLATTKWKNANWKKYLANHVDGYEQFGALYGVVNGEAFDEGMILNLPACRTRYGGPDEIISLEKQLKIFLPETNGVLINLTVQLSKEGQLSYGYINHKRLITESIRIKNISLKDAPKIPDSFVVNICTKSDEFSCVVNLNKSFLQNTNGCELHTGFAECGVNATRGRALIELQNYTNNVVELPKIKPLICEKKVEILPKNLIVNIKSSEAQILDLTGGKGNSLALLASIQSKDFIVPDGFIITINAFKAQLNSSKSLREAIKTVNEAFCGYNQIKPEEACNLAVRLFANETIHSDIRSEILRNLVIVTNESSGDAIDVMSWAVRSSAIGEDSEELSAAGQNETILGCVTESEVLKAVAKCWASLYTFQSVQYRWQHGMSIISDMAVVVQRMVPSETAGVIFTWHPTNSNPSEVVVTSNFGLGESVVSGVSDPDTFILKRTYDGKVEVMDQVLGSKDIVLTLTENGVQEVTDESGSFVYVNRKPGSWSLSNSQVLKLGKIGINLEQSFGGPRDIEWAFYKDDLYLLQSRPITTLTAWADFELTHEFDGAVTTETSLYTLANTGEVFPVPVTALTYCTTVRLIDIGVHYQVSGLFEPYFLNSLQTFSHRVFIDCILVMFSQSRDEEVQMDQRVLDVAIFGHEVISKSINRMVRTRLGKSSKFDRLKMTFKTWNQSRFINEIVEETKLNAKKIDYGLTEADDAQTIFNKLTRNDEFQIHSSTIHSVATQCSVFWQIICFMILIGNQKELNNGHYTDFASILSSCEDVESAEVPCYLQKISNMIKEEGYSEEFCTIKPEFGKSWLKTKCPAAHKVFEEFLQKHGHRCFAELEMMSETWGMNPSLVTPMIQANVKHWRSDQKEIKSVDQVIQDLTTPINFVAKKFLRYGLTNLRKAVGKREQSKSALVLTINKLRLGYRQLGKAMVRQGMLPSEDLIFHLTVYEIQQIVQVGGNPVYIHKAMRRQKLYQKWSNLKFPEMNYGVPQPEPEQLSTIKLMEGTKCRGTPVCNGNIQARACVISHLDEIASLEKGDILITYSTDIGWSPYFPMLSGIVTELGGLVSHGAVVAREYGIPCIVGVKNVTKMFKTGDILYLSATTGELGKI